MLTVCLWGRFKAHRRWDHVGGEADMFEESSPLWAPSCSHTELSGSQDVHSKGLSSSAQATTGDKHYRHSYHLQQIQLLYVLQLTRLTSFLYLNLTECLCQCLFKSGVVNPCLSVSRVIPPRPDLGSAKEGQPKTSSRKQRSSQFHRQPSKVNNTVLMGNPSCAAHFFFTSQCSYHYQL